MTESTEKLRKKMASLYFPLNSNASVNMLALVDEIEREIAERYIELPVDADGVPWHIGDKFPRISGNGANQLCTVTGFGDGDVFYVYSSETRMPDTFEKHRHVDAASIVHAKPRTVVDVLREVALEIIDVSYQNVPRIGNVPKLSVDEGKLRDWLEEHDELRMRDGK